MDQPSPWYLKDEGNQVSKDPLENELRYTHKKLRHVHEMLQIKTTAAFKLNERVVDFTRDMRRP